MKGCLPLTDDEFDALCQAFAGAKQSRNRALFVFGCTTGFRIAEILSLRISDIIASGTVRTAVQVSASHMKGGRSGRVVDLTEQCRYACQEWWRELRRKNEINPSSYFWPGRTVNKPLHQFHVRCILKEAAQRAGITKRVSSHTMRKTFASKVWMATERDIRKTQIALGHASIASTVSYLLGCEHEVRALVRSLVFGNGGIGHEPEQQLFNLIPFPESAGTS